MRFIKLIDVPEDWQSLRFHELSEKVEFGAGIDNKALGFHIKEHGYDEQEPIVLFDGKILDGRHRFNACRDEGIIPTFAQFIGQDPRAFVWKKLNRQHLNPSQLAMAAAEWTKMFRKTIDEAAKETGASPTSIDRALAVTEKGTEELQKAVKEGKVSVSDAYEIVHNDTPAQMQNQAVEDVERGVTATVKASVEQQTVLCPKCTRTGATKDCKMCEKVRKKALKAAAGKKAKVSKGSLKDDYGTEVPAHCRDAFGDPWLQETINFLEKTSESMRMKRISDGMAKRKKHFPFYNYRDVIDGMGFAIKYVGDVLDHLKQLRPSGVCPECDGEKCASCMRTGMVPRLVYAELKKKRKGE